jgi:hypothetical protein
MQDLLNQANQLAMPVHVLVVEMELAVCELSNKGMSDATLRVPFLESKH